MPKVIDSGVLRVTFHYEDGGWWAESPDIPRWSAAAGTFAEVCKLVAEGIPFAKEEPTTGTDLQRDRDWPVRPGETLCQILAIRGMTQTYLAWATGYSPKHINQVIQGHVSISAAMAVRLEREIGPPSAEFWMRYQMTYDLHAARKEE